MALHWNVSACAEQATTQEGWILTNALIWATMFIGINRITEKNVNEFYARLATYEDLFTPLLYRSKDGKPEHVKTSYADLRLRIGLSTNASTLTRKQFVKNLGTLIENEVNRVFRSVSEEKEAA